MLIKKKLIENCLLPNKGEQKQFKGRWQRENRTVDCAASMDQTDHQPKKRFKRLIEDFVDNSSESDDEPIRAEQEKVEKIILNLGKKAST